MFAERSFNVYKVPHQTNGTSIPRRCLAHGPVPGTLVAVRPSSQAPSISVRDRPFLIYSSTTSSVNHTRQFPYSSKADFRIELPVTTCNFTKYKAANPQDFGQESPLTWTTRRKRLVPLKAAQARGRQTQQCRYRGSVLPWGQNPAATDVHVAEGAVFSTKMLTAKPCHDFPGVESIDGPTRLSSAHDMVSQTDAQPLSLQGHGSNSKLSIIKAAVSLDGLFTAAWCIRMSVLCLEPLNDR
ncbi:hypothetical protein LZ30DRAFT_186252 [Colletotrichum cereale]|nr:hypothetical protein LZ30DRAFT_186252 [Colletotrichum cereale]